VHGRADLLAQVLDRVTVDLRKNPLPYPTLVFLGDYIDRGPASCRVVDHLLYISRHFQTIFIKGNHENCLLEFLNDARTLPRWVKNGGLYTLRSYELFTNDCHKSGEQKRIAEAMLERLHVAGHMDFFSKLRTSYCCGDFFFVHAGVRPHVPLDEQSEADLLCIRNEFLDYKKDFGKLIVHGHTPVSMPEVRPNRINIDTGAYVTGRLTCLVIEGNEIKFL